MSLPSSSRRHRLPQLLGLGLSAAALAGLVHLESVWAHADAGPDEALAADELDALDELDEEEDDEAVELAPVLAAAEPGRLADAEAPATGTPAGTAAAPQAAMMLADASIPAATAAPAAAAVAVVAVEADAEILPQGPALVVVPDLEGMNLRQARKTLKAVGLKLSARDTYNDKIPRDEWWDYEVRRQKIEPGAEVVPGTWVRVKARFEAPAVMGY